MHRNSTEAVVRRSKSSASSGSPLGKRSSSSLTRAGTKNSSPDDDNDLLLSKQLRKELKISNKRFARKLKNITNTFELQLASEDAIELARKKRKVGPIKDDSVEEVDRGTAKCARVSGEEVEVIIEGQMKLRNVLGKHYFNVGNRVHLDHVPSCLKNVKRCEKLHAQRANQAKRV